MKLYGVSYISFVQNWSWSENKQNYFQTRVGIRYGNMNNFEFWGENKQMMVAIALVMTIVDIYYNNKGSIRFYTNIYYYNFSRFYIGST